MTTIEAYSLFDSMISKESFCANPYSRFPDSLYYLPEKYVRKIVRSLAFEWKKMLIFYPECYVSGSFCLAALDDFDWIPNDIDFFVSQKSYRSCVSNFFPNGKEQNTTYYGKSLDRDITTSARNDSLGYKAQIICNTYRSIPNDNCLDILEFDLSINSLGVCYNPSKAMWEGFCSEGFLVDWPQRKFRVEGKHSSFLDERIEKYKKRGFTLI